jgi:hypothetical protein
MTSKRANVLVVILIVGVGIGLLIPAIGHLRAAANGRQTMERMQKLALALHACNEEQKLLPPAFDSFRDIRWPASLHVHLLRFLGEDAAYRSYVEGEGNSHAALPVFHSPADPTLSTGTGVQNYAANLRVFSDVGVDSYGYSPGKYKRVPLSAIMPGKASIPRTFLDGTSNTIILATKLAACDQFLPMGIFTPGGSHYDADPTSPHAAFFGDGVPDKPAHVSDPDAVFQLNPGAECRFSPLLAQSFGPHGITVAMGDGSVRVIAPNIAPLTWLQALQPNNCNYGGTDW